MLVLIKVTPLKLALLEKALPGIFLLVMVLPQLAFPQQAPTFAPLVVFQVDLSQLLAFIFILLIMVAFCFPLFQKMLFILQFRPSDLTEAIME